MTCRYPSDMSHSRGHRFQSGNRPHHSNCGPPPTNFGFRPHSPQAQLQACQGKNGRPDFQFGNGPQMGVHRLDNPLMANHNRFQNTRPEIQRFRNNSFTGSPECYRPGGQRPTPQPRPQFGRGHPRLVTPDRPHPDIKARGLGSSWDPQRYPCHNVNSNKYSSGNFVTSNRSDAAGKHNRPIGLPGNCKRKENDKSYQDGNFNIQNPKKQKIDKRDLAENNKYSCDTCDRGFKTEEKYTEHVLGHEQCRVDGCPYVAAPRLVQLHYTMQHRSGMARKIWGSETEADIQKWIQERKRNYPTEKNVAKKQTVLEEKQARGEVLETKEFGRLSNSRRNRRGRRHRMAEQRTQANVEMTPVETPQDTNDKNDSLSSVMMKNGKVVSDRPTETKTQNGTSDTCAEHSDTQSVTKKSFNGDAHADTSSRPGGNSGFNQKSRANRKHVPNVPRRPPTLLQKLLAADIRHERNVILQCVRYTVQQQFFAPDKTKSQPGTRDITVTPRREVDQPSTRDITVTPRKDVDQPVTPDITVTTRREDQPVTPDITVTPRREVDQPVTPDITVTPRREVDQPVTPDITVTPRREVDQPVTPDSTVSSGEVDTSSTVNITVDRREVDESAGIKCVVNVDVTTDETSNAIAVEHVDGESSKTAGDEGQDVIEGEMLSAQNT